MTNFINYQTKKAFVGDFNIKSLAITCLLNKYNSNEFATYKQFKEVNRIVKKGESGTPVKLPLFKKNDDDTEIVKGFKIYYVFNLEQTEELNKEIINN